MHPQRQVCLESDRSGEDSLLLRIAALEARVPMIRSLLRSALFFVPIVGVGCAVVTDAKPINAPTPSSDDQGVAVVELFTSEGCSSCPPADAVLARLAGEATRKGRPVHVLSFHVDYWNRLGWTDPFSNADYTTRQREYARVHKRDGTYTPQMVVNGIDEFVGSDAKEADRAVAAALARPASATVTLKASALEKTVSVEYEVAAAPVGSVLCFVWADAEAESRPTRGENGGSKLLHVNIVRDLRILPLKGAASGKLTLSRPEAKVGSVVAFVQEVDFGRIVGASAVRVK